MGDFEVEDWMQLADKELDEIVINKDKQFQDQILNVKIQKKESPQVVQIEQKSQEVKKPIQKVVQKPTPMSNQQKRKAELLARLNDQKLILDLFDGLTTQNKQYTSAQIILKNEKDFVNYAKTIYNRFDQSSPSQFLQDFCNQLLINVYSSLNGKQYDQIWQKLKVLKNQKKKDDKQKQKQKKKKKQTKVEKKQEKPVNRLMAAMDDFM